VTTTGTNLPLVNKQPNKQTNKRTTNEDINKPLQTSQQKTYEQLNKQQTVTDKVTINDNFQTDLTNLTNQF
jgi:hypothetical protein